MTLELDDVLNELMRRLPELQWKINRLGNSISKQQIPRGIFRTDKELTGAVCIEEIKADISALSKDKKGLSAEYLAERIKEKINILVSICHLKEKQENIKKTTHFGLKAIATRQQWIENLEEEIAELSKQEHALNSVLNIMKPGVNDLAILNVRAELGELQRRLTTAKESLSSKNSGT